MMSRLRFELALWILTAFGSTGAFALDWKPQPIGSLEAECVRFAEPNGFADHARRLHELDATFAWIPATIEFCERRLRELGPREYRDPELRAALRLLDFPLHVDNYSPTNVTEVERKAFESCAIAYARRAATRVLKETKDAVIQPGTLRAWHVYNMAYVLKGTKHTVLIDFTPYPFSMDGTQKTWTDAMWCDLADLGDVLVVTHPHRDHTSYPLMAKMRGQGKSLVLPCVMTNRADGTVYAHGGNVHVLASDHADGVEIGGVRFWNFMGAQDSVPCNTYLMEIDGVRVADNGDSSSKEREWNLTKCPPADIIISSTWSLVTNIVRACQATPGFRNDRAIFLPSHENEIMHSVPHRESYRELYESPVRLGCPDFRFPRTFPLAWGESVLYDPRRN